MSFFGKFTILGICFREKMQFAGREVGALDKWKRKFEDFMRGRNGVDHLGQFLTVTSVILLLISGLVKNYLLSLLACAALIYAYFRFFSKNLSARQGENRRYLAERERLRFKIQTKKLHFSMRKTHKYFKCKKCRKKLRVPRGKGKIEVTCPHCGEKFITKT